MTGLIKEFPDLKRLIKKEKSFYVCHKPSVIIAITARSGSTNLCSVLESSNKIGNPTEILNPRGVVQSLKNKYNVSTFNDYIEALTHHVETFSFKTNWNDFKFISKYYKQIFPNSKFVFLDRLDFFAQAVSGYKARKTGQWHCLMPKQGDDQQTKIPDEVDYDLLKTLINNIFHDKINWEKFFFNNNINALHLYYEIVSQDWIKAGKQILDYAGIQFCESDLTEGNYTKLPDNKAWQKLFNAAKRKLGLSWIDHHVDS